MEQNFGTAKRGNGAGDKAALGNVLVIDDEPGIRRLLAFELGDRGYRVWEAADGMAGVQAAKEKPVDVAFLDLTMPQLGGLETLSLLKADCPGVEVVLMTGHATLETAVEGMKRGAYDYLSKPFQLGEMMRVLEGAMKKRLMNLCQAPEDMADDRAAEQAARRGKVMGTLLNVIIGYTSLVLQGAYGDLSEKQKEGLRRVETNARRLLRMMPVSVLSGAANNREGTS